jgi:hypothetical protein
VDWHSKMEILDTRWIFLSILLYKKINFKYLHQNCITFIMANPNPYCQGIRRIRIGIPGNSKYIWKGIPRYSPEYFRNSNSFPLVARESTQFQVQTIFLSTNNNTNYTFTDNLFKKFIYAFSRITFITLSAYFPIFRILFGISINKYDFYLSYWANTEKGTEFWTNISSSCRDMSLGLYNVHYT